MGWDFQHRERGTSNADFMAANLGEGYDMLASATVGGTFYAAVRRPDGLVEAFVTLTKWVPRDYFNFGKKDMTEAWGPVETRCPDRILDLLSPVELLFGVPEYETETTSTGTYLRGKNSAAWAEHWRLQCRKYNERVGKVKRGSTILHAGTRYLAVDLRRNLFRGEFGTLYRFPHWRTVNFEVVA